MPAESGAGRGASAMKEPVLEAKIDCSEYGWRSFIRICLKCGGNSRTDSALMMAIKERSRMTFEESSGKVLADIGFANPEREQLKAHLTLQICRIIKSRGLTHGEGARRGIKQPPRFGPDA
jgi:hypothetical protein